MHGARAKWRRAGARLVGGLVAPVLLSVTGAGQAADLPPAEAPPAVVASTASPVVAGPLTLDACRHIALEHNAAVAAARASLAAATARQHAVENLRTPHFLARDLPVRRKQAALGVVIAQAALVRVESEVVYGATYAYLTALYAAGQRALADKAIENLEQFRQGITQAMLVRRDVTDVDRRKVVVYQSAARARREEAVQGELLALSALREALGLGPDCPVVLADSSLPDADAVVDRQQVIALALDRRSELVQAVNAAHVTALEISAQDTRTLFPSLRTFASGSDIHANPIPLGSYDQVYRPGAVGLEMPVQITGSRCDRVEQARAYNARAEAVVVKTRNLIALEAEQAYLRWQEATQKVQHLDKAARDARKLANDLRENFKQYQQSRVPADRVLDTGILATQLRADYNQARYQQRVALAVIERVTSGGFCPGFVPAAAPEKPTEQNGRTE